MMAKVLESARQRDTGRRELAQLMIKLGSLAELAGC
jgi:hypothetical protein